MCPRGGSGRPWGQARSRPPRGRDSAPSRRILNPSATGSNVGLRAWRGPVRHLLPSRVGRCGRCMPSPTRMPAPRRRGRGPTRGPVEVHLGANVGLREGCRDAKHRAKRRNGTDRNQVQNGVAHRRLPIGPTEPTRALRGTADLPRPDEITVRPLNVVVNPSTTARDLSSFKLGRTLPMSFRPAS